MSVKDDERNIRETIESVLDQSGVDFELIIVNDGSTDGTGRILADYGGRYGNIRILEQSNKGLTRSLIVACRIASGKYIARQDGGGDTSLPGRFRRQYELLEAGPEAMMVCGGVRMVGPQREYLYDAVISQEDLEKGLSSTKPSGVRGPAHHGATMMRRASYEQIGGYREEFGVAQDLDLWVRIFECGKVIADENIVYQATVTPTSLSSLFRKKQLSNTRLILEARRYRMSGRDDRLVLDKLRKSGNTECGSGRLNAVQQRTREAMGYYFIASCLNKNDHERARYYYRQALRKHPFFVKAAIRFTLSYFNR